MPLEQEIDDNTKQNGQSVLEGDMMMRGMNTHLSTLFPMMISALMTR
jgi:hypothetical protein